MKLEDINKKNIYTVPDKYFDRLPGRIQARIQAEKPRDAFSFSWSFAYKIAAPALAVLLLIFYFGYNRPADSQSIESLLSQVATEDLVAYLESTDITTDEILESIDFENIDMDLTDETVIMPGVELNDESIESLIDEFAIDEALL